MLRSDPCPACGEPLFGWLQIPAGSGDRLLQRCENCGLGLAAGMTGEGAVGELLRSSIELSGGRRELRAPNRASVQARLGGRHWAALDPSRVLYATPDSLSRLTEVAGLQLEELRTPQGGRPQEWMWQTILNAFTFTENFARDFRASRMRAAGAAGWLRFAVDALVTLLAALPAALISAPLELAAALTGRGGELVAVVPRPER